MYKIKKFGIVYVQNGIQKVVTRNRVSPIIIIIISALLFRIYEILQCALQICSMPRM